MDSHIIQNCIDGKRRAWKNLVDRFLGLVLHVVDHLCEAQGRRISEEEREKLCEVVFQELRRNQYRILKEYQGSSSVSNYLAIIARRVVAKQLVLK